MTDFSGGNKERRTGRRYYGAYCSGCAFGAMIASFLLISFFGQTILNAFGVTEGVLFYALNLLFPIIAMLSVIVFLRVKRGQGMLVLTRYAGFKPYYAVIAVAIAACMTFGFGFVNASVAELMRKLGLKAQGINLTMNSAGEFVLYAVTAALLPAIFEEAFFRGVMLDGIACFAESAFSRRNVQAALTTAACFAVYHGALSQFFYQFIYGAVLAFLALSCKSVFPSAAAHFINNFFVLFCAYKKLEINLFNPVGIVLGITGIIVVLTLLVFLNSRDKKTATESDNASRPHGCEDACAEKSLKKFWLPFGLAAFLVCVVLLVGSALL